VVVSVNILMSIDPATGRLTYRDNVINAKIEQSILSCPV